MSFLDSLGSVASGFGSAGSIVSGIGKIASAFGGGKSALKQMNQQSEVARRHQQYLDISRPTWMVKGAKDAGVHPLTVFGSQAGAPASASFGSFSGSSVADNLQQMGQGVSSIAHAYSTREEKSLATQSAALGVENQKLQNDRLRSEIALMNQPGRASGVSSSAAIPGQPDSAVGVRLVPKEDTLNLSGNSPGVRPAAQDFEYPGLGKVRHMNDAAAEATEDDFLSKALFASMYTFPDVFRNIWNKTRHMRQYNGRDLLPYFEERR